MAPLAPPKFIQTYLPLAQQWEGKTGIPASMYLAIIASESNWGNADNALFGIKGQGTAGSFRSPSWEGVDKQHRTDTVDDFRNYNTPEEAFQGFWDFLHQNPRYADALTLLPNDPTAFLYAINRAGYAKDQTWADSITNIQSRQIEPMIQRAGDTMGQMQDGDPNLAIDPALVDAAINGDTPGATTGGYVPDGNVGTLANNKPASDPNATPQGQMNGNDILQLIVDKLGPYASRVVLNPTTTTNDPILGQTTGPNKTPTYRYTWANGKTLDVAALDSGAVVKGGTALATLSSGSSPSVREFPDHSLRQEDTSQPLGSSGRWVKIADAPAEKTATPKTINTKGGTFENDGSGWTLIPGTAPAGASLQIHTFGDGSLHSYDPQTGQWALVQDRYVDPAEAAYKTALTNEANANTAKTQQGLRPIALAAIQDAGATIEAIKQQWVSGALGTGREAAQKAQALMDQVSQGLSATLAGTTIFDLNKQAQDTATQRASTAASLVNQRVQSSSSLGAALFSAATANGGILMPKGGGSWNINPLDIANQEVNQMGGGQQTGDAATAFLRSVFGGGAPGAGASPTDAGAPQQGQFPTTREAVLAQYPHLATPPPTQNAQFIPPNLEQGAGGPGIAPMQQTAPTVLPPRPLSPANARIQAGG